MFFSLINPTSFLFQLFVTFILTALNQLFIVVLGPNGDRGFTGETGFTGDTGFTGNSGPNGYNGDTGDAAPFPGSELTTIVLVHLATLKLA